MKTTAFSLRQVHDAELTGIARDLFTEYADAIGVDLEYQGFGAELATLPGPYLPPAGALIIAFAGESAAGCVAMRPLRDHAAEMKRLYVRPTYRGTGLGRHLVETVIGAARDAGYANLYLDTLDTLTAARALYHQLGFVQTAPYNTGYLPGTCFYMLTLAGSTHQ